MAGQGLRLCSRPLHLRGSRVSNHHPQPLRLLHCEDQPWRPLPRPLSCQLSPGARRGLFGAVSDDDRREAPPQLPLAPTAEPSARTEEGRPPPAPKFHFGRTCDGPGRTNGLDRSVRTSPGRVSQAAALVSVPVTVTRGRSRGAPGAGQAAGNHLRTTPKPRLSVNFPRRHVGRRLRGRKEGRSDATRRRGAATGAGRRSRGHGAARSDPRPQVRGGGAATEAARAHLPHVTGPSRRPGPSESRAPREHEAGRRAGRLSRVPGRNGRGRSRRRPLPGWGRGADAGRASVT